MARAGVSYHEVAQTADALQDAGFEPTIDRVRERLGTGSKSTLAPLLKRWKAQRDTAVAGQGLPSDLLQAVKGLHVQMQQSATQQIEAARQEFATAEAALRQQVVDSHQELSKLQQRHQALDTEHTSLREAHQHLIDEHHRERAVAAAQGAELAEVRARLGEAQSTVIDLKQELRQARAQSDHYQQTVAEERRHERERVQQMQAEWQAAREDWNRRLTSETAARQAAEVKVQQQDARYRQLEKNHVELQGELEQRRSETQRQQQQLAELALQLRTLQDERLRTAAESAELRALKDHQEALNAQQEQRIQGLEAKLVKAEDRFAQLLDENRFLQQEKAELQANARLLSASVPSPRPK